MTNIRDQFDFNRKNYFDGELSNKKIDLSSKVSIRDCDFSYLNESKKILNNLSYDFELGKIYGIKGPSGSGKTTLLNIMTGLLEPTNGTLYVDDKRITKENIKQFQNIISYVPQNTFLFDSSILNNISFDFSGKEKINYKKINDIIEKLSLNEKISNLKDGLKTNIGERGVNLSGGQRQRIGIARALYINPKILVLDESTNSIEKDIEKIVLNYLKSIKKEMIIILAAHRETSFQFVDEVLELKNRRLIKLNQ